MSNTVINTNVMALNSHRNLKIVGDKQSTASARLSSGYKINSAADDAAGLAISEKMRAQIRGLDMASKNTQDAISLIQTAEGGMTEIGNMAQRMRELLVQAANGTNTSDAGTGDRSKIQLELNALISEIDSMSARVEFNTKKVLVSYGASQLFMQVGANASQSISFCIGTMDSATLSIDVGTIIVSNTDGSTISQLVSTVNNAVNTVANERAKLGAIQNRLTYTMRSLDISSENLSASESRIRDADMAKEMMRYTQANVLQQAGISMLSQANQAPQNILSLLR